MTRLMLPATLVLSLVVLLASAAASAQTAASSRANASWTDASGLKLDVLDGPGPLTSAALREASRLAARDSPAAPQAEHAARHGWIHRHPVWFATLVGAAAGEAWALADAANDDPHYWGEAAVMGGLFGAGVGALVGVIWDGVRK
jgi:hypothetical protein